MRGNRFSKLLLAVLILGAPQGARALTYTVAGGSVDLAQFCTSFLCTTETLTQSSGGVASGSITVDGGLVDFDIDVTVLSFAGAPDNGVTAVAFNNLSYQASGLTLVGTPSDFTATGSASVSATLDQTPGGSSAYAASPAINLDCEETAPSTLTCGLVVSGFNFTVAIGGPPVTRHVPHTVDLTSVPEPDLSVMALSASLVGLAYARRKSMN
jgi:hypothetical protein